MYWTVFNVDLVQSCTVLINIYFIVNVQRFLFQNSGTLYAHDTQFKSDICLNSVLLIETYRISLRFFFNVFEFCEEPSKSS